MRGARPDQAPLTRDNDLTKTEETRRVVEAMVDGLNDHEIDGMSRHFAEDFRWIGNAGCGVKEGLSAFQNNWQRPFQAAFADKVCLDEARLAEGEWMAAFGHQTARHAGPFMGIAPTGRRVEIRYMDFWKVVDGRIVENHVMVDFPHVLRQLGVDPFRGEGWEVYDRGERVAPRPDAPAPAARDGSPWSDHTRSPAMTESPSIVPYFSYVDAKAAMTFLADAFGFETVQAYDGSDGALQHGEMKHGRGVIMLGTADAPPKTQSPGVYVVVEDVDAHHARAVAAGAEIVYPPEDTEWGTRRYRARDPEGHEWSFGTYAPSTTPPSW